MRTNRLAWDHFCTSFQGHSSLFQGESCATVWEFLREGAQKDRLSFDDL